MAILRLIAMIFTLSVVGFLLLFSVLIERIPPGYVGVRFNNISGLHHEDLQPGWALEMIGIQRINLLPSKFLMLNYSGTTSLSIRTKDNNTVSVDVSVPYHIIKGMAHKVVDAGNHMFDGSKYRFERFANDTAISVLREHLAALKSHDFYDTNRRLEVTETTKKILNQKLKSLHLEASHVLIRAAYFRDSYEKQLAQIQLNEQQKLLDKAKQDVADKQQTLDNYTQQTAAMVAAKEQDWNRRIAELKRAYQVGFLAEYAKAGGGNQAGTQLENLSPSERDKIKMSVAGDLGINASEVIDAHIKGIKNIQAETTRYDNSVRAEASGIADRLAAEGVTEVAKVKAAYEMKVNKLLSSPGGRAYVAYQAAANIKFNSELGFQSREGIPSVLKLYDFARTFMGTNQEPSK